MGCPCKNKASITPTPIPRGIQPTPIARPAPTRADIARVLRNQKGKV